MAEISLSRGSANSAEPVGYESVVVGIAAVGLTPVAAGSACIITVDTQDIRYRFDGGDPTATEGHLAVSGDVIHIDRVSTLSKFRAIRTGGTDGAIRVTYFR